MLTDLYRLWQQLTVLWNRLQLEIRDLQRLGLFSSKHPNYPRDQHSLLCR